MVILLLLVFACLVCCFFVRFVSFPIFCGRSRQCDFPETNWTELVEAIGFLFYRGGEDIWALGFLFWRGGEDIGAVGFLFQRGV